MLLGASAAERAIRSCLPSGDSGELPAMEGRHDLCLRFTQHELDPMWGVDWVRIGGGR